MRYPGSVHDDFWCFFISIWTSGFSCVFSLVKMYQPRKEIIFYYICLNKNPELDSNLEARADDQFEPLFCFLLHLAITIRVQVFKFQKSHNSSTTQQSQISTITQMYFQNIEKVTLADFLTSSILACWVGSLAVLQNKIETLTLAEISSPRYSFFLFGFLYYANSISCMVISGVYICRHSHLRRKLKKELILAIKNVLKI